MDNEIKGEVAIRSSIGLTMLSSLHDVFDNAKYQVSKYSM